MKGCGGSLLWCKLALVRRPLPAKRLSWNAVFLMLVVLQLTLGLQLQAARAVASPMPLAKQSMAHHAGAASPDAISIDQHTQASQPDCPKHSLPHDCCHANACQCQSAYTPGAMTLPALPNIVASVSVLFFFVSFFVVFCFVV